MFGAPFGAWTGCGKSDFESLARRLMVPWNGWGGSGSTVPTLGGSLAFGVVFSWAVASRPEAVSQPSRAPAASSVAAARVVRVRMGSSPEVWENGPEGHPP